MRSSGKERFVPWLTWIFLGGGLVATVVAIAWYMMPTAVARTNGLRGMIAAPLLLGLALLYFVKGSARLATARKVLAEFPTGAVRSPTRAQLDAIRKRLFDAALSQFFSTAVGVIAIYGLSRIDGPSKDGVEAGEVWTIALVLYCLVYGHSAWSRLWAAIGLRPALQLISGVVVRSIDYDFEGGGSRPLSTVVLYKWGGEEFCAYAPPPSSNAFAPLTVVELLIDGGNPDRPVMAT